MPADEQPAVLHAAVAARIEAAYRAAVQVLSQKRKAPAAEKEGARPFSEAPGRKIVAV